MKCLFGLHFTANELDNFPIVTKRKILSTIAKLFDLLGWLAPIVIVAKVLIQNVWPDET